MKINFNSKLSKEVGTMLFVCIKNKPMHKYLTDLEKNNKKLITKAMKVINFDYKENNQLDLILPSGSKADRIIVIGAEIKKINDVVGLGKLGSSITSIINNKKIKEISLVLESKIFKPKDVALLLFGVSLNTYRFNKYFSSNDKKRLNYIEKINLFYENINSLKSEWKRFNAIKEGVFLTRDLVSEPSNNLTPYLLAKEATKLRKIGLRVEQLDEKKLKDLKLNSRDQISVAMNKVSKSAKLVADYSAKIGAIESARKEIYLEIGSFLSTNENSNNPQITEVLDKNKLILDKIKGLKKSIKFHRSLGT